MGFSKYDADAEKVGREREDPVAMGASRRTRRPLSLVLERLYGFWSMSLHDYSYYNLSWGCLHLRPSP